MEQERQPLQERDADEAAHRQLEETEKKPIAPPTQDDIVTEEHDLDEEAHRQLEEKQ